MKEQAFFSQEIPRFSDGAREALLKKGFVIYELTGKSIQNHREEGRKLWSVYAESKAIDTIASRKSEVAVHPAANSLLLTKRKEVSADESEDTEKMSAVESVSFSVQEAMVLFTYTKALRESVPDVHAEVGSVADIVEVVFAHYAASGERLYGKEYNNLFTRTKTPTAEHVYTRETKDGDSYMIPKQSLPLKGKAHVGSFDEVHGLGIGDYPAAYGDYFIRVTPLIVPGDPKPISLDDTVRYTRG